MSIKIEITGESRTMKSKAGNDMIIQTAYAHLPSKKYPQECEILLPKGLEKYAVGLYQLAPESFQIGEYKSLDIRPVLVPLQQPKA